MKTLVQQINETVQAYKNCITVKNEKWENIWKETLEMIERNRLPSGSGFDAGSTIDINTSTPERVVLRTSFHHMDEYGGYTKWTEHEIIVRPTFSGIDVCVKGEDHDSIIEYITDMFYDTLIEEA